MIGGCTPEFVNGRICLQILMHHANFSLNAYILLIDTLICAHKKKYFFSSGIQKPFKWVTFKCCKGRNSVWFILVKIRIVSDIYFSLIVCKIFEVGDVAVLDEKKDVGAANRRQLAALYCGATSGFEVNF